MEERKKLLQSIAERSLNEIVKKKGGNTSKSVFENLEFLTTSTEMFGEKRYYIPLATKEALARLVDPDVRYEYDVSFSKEGAVQVICKLIWSDNEVPSGTGISTRFLNSIFKMDSLTDEDRKEKWVKTVMSLARADAIRDALSLSAYDFDESERQVEAEEKEIIRRKTTKKAATKKEPTVAPPPAILDELPFEDEPETETVAEPVEIAEPVSDSDALAAAKDTVADLGTFQGYKLGLIYEKNPKALIWLINRGSAVSEQARIICESDPELAEKL